MVLGIQDHPAQISCLPPLTELRLAQASAPACRGTSLLWASGCIPVLRSGTSVTHHNVDSYDLRIHTDGLDKRSAAKDQEDRRKEPETHLRPWAWLPGAPYPLMAMPKPARALRPSFRGEGLNKGHGTPAGATPSRRTSRPPGTAPSQKETSGGEKNIISKSTQEPTCLHYQEANKRAPEGPERCHNNRGGKLGGPHLVAVLFPQKIKDGGSPFSGGICCMQKPRIRWVSSASSPGKVGRPPTAPGLWGAGFHEDQLMPGHPPSPVPFRPAVGWAGPPTPWQVPQGS